MILSRLPAAPSQVRDVSLMHGSRLEGQCDWTTKFRVEMTRWRATREQPGLMRALDRGGQCKGVLYRLAGGTAEVQLGKLVRREIKAKPPSNMPRWLPVETDKGPLRAIAFTMNRNGGAYAGRLPPEQIADMLAKACGRLGSCAEYLYNTVSHLEARGIHDRNLWRLQRLAAERLSRLPKTKNRN